VRAWHARIEQTKIQIVYLGFDRFRSDAADGSPVTPLPGWVTEGGSLAGNVVSNSLESRRSLPLSASVGRSRLSCRI
jgi:hypothetical protein